MKKLLLGVWLFLSTSLALAQMPEKTRQEVAQAIQQGNYEHTPCNYCNFGRNVAMLTRRAALA